MATLYPISTLPNGTVPTNTALALVDVSTVGENASVTTLGNTAVGDGGGSTFFFQAGSARTADALNVVSTPTTGRWISTSAFSGVGPVTTALTGYNETFAILSGFVPVTYTLPLSSNVLGKVITVKCVTTGTATIRCNTPGDLIVDNNGLSAATAVASLTTTLTGGQAFNFIAPYAGRFFRIDKVV